MKICIFTFSIYLLSVYPVFSQSHRSLLPLQFAPAPDASITLIPATSPSEIPSNSPSQPPFSYSPFDPPVSSPFRSPVSSPFRPPVSLWCIAKPNTPADKLQEAMDYACGTGGVNCEVILPGGPCFYPNTVIAHASFAFNSYWQFAKNEAGNCDFDGAAMFVTSDPSFQGCHFVLV